MKKFDVRRIPAKSPNDFSGRAQGRIFVPCTRAVHVGEGVFYRPIRSWSTNVFAGEGLEIIGEDRSGCAYPEKDGIRKCSLPRTYTHRLYWHEAEPDCTVSAFLSYPGAMGYYTGTNEYFWEANLNDYERFVGLKAEERLERAILKWFQRRHAKKKKRPKFDGRGRRVRK